MSEEETTVDITNNHVYFYGDVDMKSGLEVIKKLKEVDEKLVYERYVQKLSTNAPIWLHVYSYGGETSVAFSIVDTVNTLETPVYSISEGMVASAGTIITMGCKKRYTLPNTMFLIHQLSGWAFGTYEQMLDASVFYDNMMNNIIRFYVKNSILKKKEVKKLLRRDTWFNAETAVELGICDKVLTKI
jgi:ATP-dependent Clp protease protease subunit